MFIVDAQTITWIWIVVGALLILLELLVPGAVVVFLGLAAIIVGVCRFLGLFADLSDAFVAWFILSLVLILLLRSLVRRFFPAETSFKSISDESDSYGQVVEVVERIGEKDPSGRIRYQGTSWSAVSRSGEIEQGAKARILCRENLVFVVEPCDEEFADL